MEIHLEKNHDKANEYDRKYNAGNHDKINKSFPGDCGLRVLQKNKWKRKNTKLHQELLASSH